jgi:hypothetical protein
MRLQALATKYLGPLPIANNVLGSSTSRPNYVAAYRIERGEVFIHSTYKSINEPPGKHDIMEVLAHYLHRLHRVSKGEDENGTASLAATLDDAFDATKGQPASSNQYSPGLIPRTMNFGAPYFTLSASAEQLLSALKRFVVIQAASAEAIIAVTAANLSKVIDSLATFSEEEKALYRWQLQTSILYSRLRIDIEDVEQSVPEAAMLLLGKLAAGGGRSGGFSPGSFEAGHLFDSD